MKLRRGLRVAFAATAGVGVLVLGTASAGARSDAAKAPSATSAVSGDIVLAHWSSSPVETELLTQVVRSFERKYPRIHVTRRALDPGAKTSSPSAASPGSDILGSAPPSMACVEQRPCYR